MSLQIDQQIPNTAEARLDWAVRFLDDHAAQHLEEAQLIERCAEAMLAEFEVSRRMARSVALHALAAVQTRHTPAYVDVNTSTSHVITVVDPNNKRAFAFTASELVRIGSSIADGPEHAMRACGRAAHH